MSRIAALFFLLFVSSIAKKFLELQPSQNSLEVAYSDMKVDWDNDSDGGVGLPDVAEGGGTMIQKSAQNDTGVADYVVGGPDEVKVFKDENEASEYLWNMSLRQRCIHTTKTRYVNASDQAELDKMVAANREMHRKDLDNENGNERCFNKQILITGTKHSDWHFYKDGSKFGCEWFKEDLTRCDKFSCQSEFKGEDALGACCVCGGGIISIGAESRSMLMTRAVNPDVTKGLQTVADTTQGIGEVLEKIDAYKVSEVSTKIGKVASVLGGAGIFIGVFTAFLPQPDSDELVAIKEGFNVVNRKLDKLATDVTQGFNDLTEVLVNVKLDEMKLKVEESMIRYRLYREAAASGSLAGILRYRSEFENQICKSSYDVQPQALFRYFYSHSCKACNAWGTSIKPNTQFIETLTGQGATVTNLLQNDYKKFQRTFVKLFLSALMNSFFLYSACPTFAGDSVKVGELGRMATALREIGGHFQEKVIYWEHNWNCNIYNYDLPNGNRQTIFNHLNNKYPNKHWQVTVYNDVGGGNNHWYYHYSNCQGLGKTHYGIYHGVKHGKEIHIRWKNNWDATKKIAPHPSSEFPAKCTKSCEYCCATFFVCVSWCNRNCGACGGGAKDVFGKSTRKNIVVKHGNGLGTWHHSSQFGFENIATDYNGGYTVIY